jgi:hypothetical protein
VTLFHSFIDSDKNKQVQRNTVELDKTTDGRIEMLMYSEESLEIVSRGYFFDRSISSLGVRLEVDLKVLS